MAIKGGNPLFKVETKTNGSELGFIGTVILPTTGETITQEFDESHPLYRDFAMFGYETKTRNTIGAITDPEKRTPEGAQERALAITAAYDEGEWNIGRGDGEGAPSGGYAARAVAEVLGKEVSAVVEHIQGQYAEIREDKKKFASAMRAAWESLALDPRFAPVVARLKEEAAAKKAAKQPKVETTSLLAGL